MAEEDWAEALGEQERQLSSQVAHLTVNEPVKTTPTGPPGSAPPPTAAAKPDSQSSAVDDADKETSTAEASLLTKLIRTKLVDNKNDVEIQRADPTSPLYSVKSFEELRLRPNLLKGVYGMGFNRPSKIQEMALPLLLADPPTNLIAQSQSGTGKTAAFVLAMLSRVDPAKNHSQIICLSPTFDLAQQTGSVLHQMASHCPEITMAYAVRGQRVEPRVLRSEHVIMGTSGTVLDWMLKKRVIDPARITMFVLDEADVMIDQQGQQDQTIRIQKQLPKSCQMVLFSATYNDAVMKFATSVIPNAMVMRLKRSEESLDNIKQFYVVCQNEEDKFQALSNLYGTISIGQAMVFTHTRKSAAWLAGKMSREGHAVALITGESTTEQRIAVLSRFREGKEKLLITTNLCARGIDVEQVTVVINYDIPMDAQRRPDSETYLHRIGRTGRFGRSGLAINFVDGQRSMQNLRKIEEHFNRKIERLSLDDPDEIEQAVAL